MKEMELHNQDFEISISLNGSPETFTISPEETTDGVEYFSCSRGDKKITQLRKDEDGKWEQIWGELDTATIDAIGKAIADKTD